MCVRVTAEPYPIRLVHWRLPATHPLCSGASGLERDHFSSALLFWSYQGVRACVCVGGRGGDAGGRKSARAAPSTRTRATPRSNRDTQLQTPTRARPASNTATSPADTRPNTNAHADTPAAQPTCRSTCRPACRPSAIGQATERAQLPTPSPVHKHGPNPENIFWIFFGFF